MADFNIQELLDEPIASKYDELNGLRTALLTTNRDCSALTIASVLPPDGHTEQDTLDTPYQSLGARLVNNLASKLLMTLLPPSSPFFRVYPNEEKQKALDEDETQKQETEAMMVAIETDALKTIEKQNIRVPTFEALKALIISGNALLVKVEEGYKGYRLDNYVVKRDYRGNLIEVITRETINPNVLPDDIYTALAIEPDDTKPRKVYVRCVLRQNKWYEYQYVDDVLVEGSDTTYTAETMPYLALRWTAINGHNYGVGLTEQYLGDFRTLEGAYQLLLENASVAGRTVFGLKHGSMLDVSELNDASNGDVIMGDFESELTVMRVEKNNDLVLVQGLIDQITRRLEQAYLNASSVARESERTTATEIRYMASQLEETLGGTYSVLASDYQTKTAGYILEDVDVEMGDFDFSIVTGIEALGRNSDLDKLRQFTAIINESGFAEQIAQRVNIDNYINDMTNALSLPSGRYIKTEEQLAGEQQQAQQNEMMQQGGNAMAQQAGAGVGQAMAGQQQ